MEEINSILQDRTLLDDSSQRKEELIKLLERIATALENKPISPL